MVRAAERLRIEQQDAAVLGRRGHDLLVPVPDDGRPGRELCSGLREPVLQLERLRIERDDRVRFALARRLTTTNGGEQRPVGRKRHRTHDRPAAGPPRHHRLRVAVQIDRPDGVGRAATTARGRRIQAGVDRDRRGPPRVRRQEGCGALHILSGRQTEHVQQAVAGDHVPDTGRTGQESEGSCGSLFARGPWDALGRLPRAPRDPGGVVASAPAARRAPAAATWRRRSGAPARDRRRARPPARPSSGTPWPGSPSRLR